MQRREAAKSAIKSLAAVAAGSFGGILMAEDTKAAEAAPANASLADIYERLTMRDVPEGVKMAFRMRALVLTAALTSLGARETLSEHFERSLEAGVKPVDLFEAVVQTMAYSGLAHAMEAQKLLEAAMAKAGIAGQIEDCTVVSDADRFERGLAVQKGIFGSAIDQMHQSAKADERFISVDLLTGFCFGDTYTRTGLTLKERELLTFVTIVSMGGCDPQAKAHAAGNIAVGNSRDILLDAIAVALPAIGFPKTLNALAAINSAAPAE